MKTIAELECPGGRFREGWGPGAVEGVSVNAARRELQEGTRVGSTGRGRHDGRNRGLELGAREELLEKLLWLKGGEKKHKRNERKVWNYHNQKFVLAFTNNTKHLPHIGNERLGEFL